ncbi:Uncharacterised protein [Bordetella pertussis]|nr:Uncharacterised protein [Bordetella pertussis]CFW41811.1 Uncharacterised protein [Bordetella pertussis]
MISVSFFSSAACSFSRMPSSSRPEDPREEMVAMWCSF